MNHLSIHPPFHPFSQYAKTGCMLLRANRINNKRGDTHNNQFCRIFVKLGYNTYLLIYITYNTYISYQITFFGFFLGGGGGWGKGVFSLLSKKTKFVKVTIIKAFGVEL